ncbi:MAG: glutamate racemase [Eubacterium sp.]|nr:glutamate racemase [Eubacterium sp.]
MDNRFIGVFDSGIGGLTSVSCIMDMFPNERILFFGDTARTPYGSKAPETIRRFTLQIGEFMKNKNVKMMVAACNTISSVSLDVLSDKYPGIPVIGTIEPTAHVVAKKCDPGEHIGILATKTTVATEMYPKSIKELKPDMENIYQKACPAFVPLIEEGIIDNPIMDQTIRYYLDDFIRENEIDTLVLACTHYPLIAPNLKRIYPGIRLINSSKETAVAVGMALEKYGMNADETQTHENTFYASDLSENFVDMIDLILKDEQDPGRIRFKNLDAISD